METLEGTNKLNDQVTGLHSNVSKSSVGSARVKLQEFHMSLLFCNDYSEAPDCLQFFNDANAQGKAWMLERSGGSQLYWTSQTCALS